LGWSSFCWGDRRKERERERKPVYIVESKIGCQGKQLEDNNMSQREKKKSEDVV
jgi:hypothetical protein